MLVLLYRRLFRRHPIDRIAAGMGVKSPARLIAWTASLFVLHVAAMAVFEGMAVFDAVWLTATTIVTVGYGDLSAESVPGRVATILLMYVGGIFVLAKAASDWFDRRAETAERRLYGQWNWNMQDHLLIIGDPASPDAPDATDQATEFFRRVIGQIRAHAVWRTVPVELLTLAFEGRGLPAELRDAGVVHRNGRASGADALASCNPDKARAVIVLARSEGNAVSDAMTFDTVDRVRGAGFTGRLVVECVDDRNRGRLTRAGATAIVRPMRGYPEMLARAVVAPGAEQIITDLFTAEGDECHRVELDRPWHGTWMELCRRMIGAGIGTPLGYADAEGVVHANPGGSRTVAVHALYIVVHESREAEMHRIPGLLAAEG